jgi:uncharacterized protein (TIGR00266 family)
MREELVISENEISKNESLNYEIIGASMPCLEIELDCRQAVIAEAGAMTYYEEGINLEVKLGDGSNEKAGFASKLFSAAKRMMSDESLFITHFTNNSRDTKKVSFSAPFPGQIIALDLKELGGKVFCQKNAFICASIGTRLSMAFTKKMGASLFGGEGFVLQKIEGSEKVFIHAGGSIVEKKLNDSALFVETGALVAFSQGITYDIETTTSIKSIMFGKEGLYLTKLSGTGTVWIQSMPFNRFAGIMSEALQPVFMEEVDKAIKKAK